jgi:hypothetical protein
MLYDFIKQEILEEWLFSVEAQLETVKRLRKVIPSVTFAVEVNQQFHREKAYVPRWDIGADNVGVEKIEEIIIAPALKILARSANGEYSSDQMLAIATKELSGLPQLLTPTQLIHSLKYQQMVLARVQPWQGWQAIRT